MRARHKLPATDGAASRLASMLATLGELADEDACLDYLRDLVFPAGAECPKCQRPTRFHRVRGRSAYACQYCGHHVYPSAQTIFRRSTTDLRTWFRAIELVGAAPDAATAGDLERELGVTRKTASRMLSLILPVARGGVRELLLQAVEPTPAAGTPETGRAGAPGTQVDLPTDRISQSRPSDPLREELLATLEGLREDLRIAEINAREVGAEVDALREAVGTLERLTAADPTP